jgi:lipopolysaccharide biosynthesis glycosyltransferase
MQIVLAADADFVMPLGVTLTSLALTHSPEELAVTILHDGMPASDVARVERGLADSLSLTWRQVTPSEVAGAHFYSAVTRASLFRLLVPRLLPSLDRVIYLDCDIVVAGSLRRLWEVDLEGALLAAVRDAGAPFPAGPYGTDWRTMGLAPDTPYFNTGVLVVPLEDWRSHDVSERVFDLLRRSKPRWGDQDGLNVVIRGDWLELSRRWNLQTPDVTGDGLAWALWRDDVESALADPAVIHYTERDKPWHRGCGHPLASRWYEVLDDSDWRGWQPRRSLLPLHRRAAMKVKRVGRRLTAYRSRAAT